MDSGVKHSFRTWLCFFAIALVLRDVWHHTAVEDGFPILL